MSCCRNDPLPNAFSWAKNQKSVYTEIRLSTNNRSLEFSEAMRITASLWPSEDLENISACPVCNSVKRFVLHSGLVDNVFRCAPGTWTLWSCLTCNCAYLDPRPTRSSIHRAYASYYTHVKAQMSSEQGSGLLGRAKRAMANGYKNWRFGTKLRPATHLGVTVALLLPSARAAIDKRFRHLPPRSNGERVLDVGFGDGSFLENAQLMGWEAVGVDFDSKVVENARLRGLNVYLGGLDALEEVDGAFDYITMNHVLEHLHDPLAVLLKCYRLLKPGGTLWLETPNVDSLGHARFKGNWRGIEAPRHLVLFNDSALKMALRQTGFQNIRTLSQASPCQTMYEMSTAMEQGKDPNLPETAALALKFEIMFSMLREFLFASRKEFLALTAQKQR